MGYAKLDIWVKDKFCQVLNSAWRMDLVLVSCSGVYLVDKDVDICNRILAMNPDIASAVPLPNYQGATRISMLPVAGKPIFHVEVDVPPNCYLVWARMCHGKNEETNKFEAIATCGSHICINLLLNSPDTCADDGLFPVAIAALQRNVDPINVGINVQVVMKVAGLKKQEVLDRANNRVNEINNGGPTELLAVNEQLRDLIQELPEECC